MGRSKLSLVIYLFVALYSIECLPVNEKVTHTDKTNTNDSVILTTSKNSLVPVTVVSLTKNETVYSMDTEPNITTTVPTTTRTTTVPTTTRTTTVPTTTRTTTVPTTTRTTTSKPSTITTTAFPSSSTTESPAKHDRAFDVPSFIGGIILALGLMAIGYVIFKFYKTRTDLSYRTL